VFPKTNQISASRILGNADQGEKNRDVQHRLTHLLLNWAINSHLQPHRETKRRNLPLQPASSKVKETPLLMVQGSKGGRSQEVKRE
jgi:hypothetical protein